MAETDRPRFTFTAGSLPPDTFQVVDFKGAEGLSRPYEFDINLVSPEAELDLEPLLTEAAVFTILRPGGDPAVFHGVPVELEQLHQTHDLNFYRVVLVPRFWRLNMTRHNQIFLTQTLPMFIEAVLKDGGLPADAFEFRIAGSYKPKEYVCQYGESHYEFACRWMEQYGLYYFFQQTDGGEKLVITDTHMAHAKRSGFPDLSYEEPSGLDESRADRAVTEFVCRTHRVPHKIKLKDYNYRRPSLNLSAEANVSDSGYGENYIYGEHFETPEEGNLLARVRAEALKAGSRTFHGRSLAAFVSPGYTCNLENHFRDSFNTDYLITGVRHEGSQTGYLVAGLGMDSVFGKEQFHYQNQFTAITADQQYRAPHHTKRPKFHGCLNAHVDAAGTGQEAELDSQGRYKIRLPFDLAGRAGGKASHWVRLAQPYAGSGYGFHAPLHKGCEVLLTFLDGNPDRPVIAGAVPNPENQGPVKDANQTKSLLHTAGGHRIEFNDQAGAERILLSTPNDETWIRLGAPNDPGETESGDMGWWGNTEHDLGGVLGKVDTKVFRNETSVIVGGYEQIVALLEWWNVLGMDVLVALGPRMQIEVPRRWELIPAHLIFGTGLSQAALDKVEAADQAIHTINDRTKALNASVKTLNTSVKAANESQAALGQKIEAANEKVGAFNSLNSAVGNKTEALDSAVRAGQTSIEEVGSKMEAIEALTEAHGTNIRNAGAAIEQIDGAMTGLSGLKSRDAAAIVKS